MLQEIESTHEVDPDGNLGGGKTTATGLEVNWQDGPLGQGEGRQEANGCFVETLIAAAIDRLQFYQQEADGRFACRENELTLIKLEEALHWQLHRTAAREIEGVEGTHAAHTT